MRESHRPFAPPLELKLESLPATRDRSYRPRPGNIGDPPPSNSIRLDVQRSAISIEHGFSHHLRQGRMRENGGGKLRLRRFQLHGDGKALDQLRRFRADEMG